MYRGRRRRSRSWWKTFMYARKEMQETDAWWVSPLVTFCVALCFVLTVTPTILFFYGWYGARHNETLMTAVFHDPKPRVRRTADHNYSDATVLYPSASTLFGRQYTDRIWSSIPISHYGANDNNGLNFSAEQTAIDCKLDAHSYVFWVSNSDDSVIVDALVGIHDVIYDFCGLSAKNSKEQTQNRAKTQMKSKSKTASKSNLSEIYEENDMDSGSILLMNWGTDSFTDQLYHRMTSKQLKQALRRAEVTDIGRVTVFNWIRNPMATMLTSFQRFKQLQQRSNAQPTDNASDEWRQQMQAFHSQCGFEFDFDYDFDDKSVNNQQTDGKVESAQNAEDANSHNDFVASSSKVTIGLEFERYACLEWPDSEEVFSFVKNEEMNHANADARHRMYNVKLEYFGSSEEWMRRSAKRLIKVLGIPHAFHQPLAAGIAKRLSTMSLAETLSADSSQVSELLSRAELNDHTHVTERCKLIKQMTTKFDYEWPFEFQYNFC